MKKVQTLIISMVLIIVTILWPINIEAVPAQVEMSSIGTSIVENGVIVANRNYVSDGKWDETSGSLFRNIVDVNGNLKIGKKYPYEISVKNSGAIDTYVRIILTKSMYNKDGEKATDLSLDVLDLHLLNSDDWIVDETVTTKDRMVMYYKKILLAGKTTTNLTDYIRIDDSILWKAEEKNITEKNGYATIMMDYTYDGISFAIDIEADAVQTHNAADAIKSAWGVNVTVDSNGDIELN